MKLRSRSARRSAAAVVTAVATLGVAGCSVFSPATVLKPYEPSDGSGGSLQGVDIRNVLLVSSGVDEPGVLSAVLVNSGTEDASVSVSVDVDASEAAAQSYFIAAGSSLHIGDPTAVAEPEAEDPATVDGRAATLPQVAWFQVPQIPVTPGETVPVTFRIDGQAQEVQAPVMLPCFEYAAITPTPAAGAAEGTAGAAAAETTPVTCGPAVGEGTSEEEH